MKKLFLILLPIFSALLLLTGCGAVEPDYTTEAFEEALNEGENLEGKTVEITVDNLEPDSAFGYNIQTGKHLNFVSSSHPDVEKGDELIVEVEEIKNVLESYVITYELP